MGLNEHGWNKLKIVRMKGKVDIVRCAWLSVYALMMRMTLRKKKRNEMLDSWPVIFLSHIF